LGFCLASSSQLVFGGQTRKFVCEIGIIEWLQEIIGKTDMEIYSGKGVSELTEFKYEVLRKGCPEKREIEFDTDLFGTRTFLIAVEPVLSLSGDAIGINFWAMDITEQAEKRNRMASLREQVAVQKAMETELNKTIHITGTHNKTLFLFFRDYIPLINS
jgi:hypothetical protein